MTINWFTVIVQIFNFLILLFILKVILYKPIFRFIKERKDSIVKKIKDAEDKIKEGEEKKAEYDKKIESFGEEKKKQKAKFLTELAKEKEESLEKVKKEIEKEREKINKQLVNNREKIIENVNKIISKKFIKFIESVFGSLADHSIEEKMVDLFIIKLKTLDKKTIFDLNIVIAKHKGIINIFTAFPLGKKSVKNLEDSLGKVKIKFKKIKFDVNPELIIGVEMRVENSYVTWNIREILEGLETNLS